MSVERSEPTLTTKGGAPFEAQGNPQFICWVENEKSKSTGKRPETRRMLSDRGLLITGYL